MEGGGGTKVRVMSGITLEAEELMNEMQCSYGGGVSFIKLLSIIFDLCKL